MDEDIYLIDFNSPDNSTYYHKVLVIEVAVHPKFWASELEEIWFLDRIYEARPIALIAYKCDTYEEYEMCTEPPGYTIEFWYNSIVRVESDNTVDWGEMDELCDL